MANWSSINMTVICRDEKSAKKLAKDLETEADVNPKWPLIFSRAPQGIFFAEIDRTGDQIVIHGDTRWAPARESAAKWIELLNSNYRIRSVEIEYDETGSQVFGVYRFDGRTITDRFLPSDRYPHISDAQFEHYFDILTDALEKYGEEEIVSAAAA